MKYMSKLYLLSVLGLYLTACANDNTPEPLSDPQFAEYTVEFALNWHEVDYPTDYPANDHFSPLIGWSHATNTAFFQVGTLASEGIKNMAELGSTSAISDEINTKIANEEGLALIKGAGLSSGVGAINVNVQVSNEFSAITLSSMVAPSPDWYVAIVNVSLLENGSFVDQLIVPIEVYDAGTDSGSSYSSTNQATSPAEAISLLTAPPLGNSSGVSPMIGTATITLIN
jgi:hypothetical protein